MTTQEPRRNLDRMERLARENDRNARDMDQMFPLGSHEDAASEFARSQAELNRIMVSTFTAINERLEIVAEEVDQVKGRQDAMGADIDQIKRRQATMADDIGLVKGGYARASVIRDASVIALDMGLGYVRTVDKYELAVWAQSHSNEGITRSDLRSFREADLVVQATDGFGIVYVAVEVSFTADKRDTDRALRNAALLTQFTGFQARAAIASVKNDDYVAEQVGSGTVHWHCIERRSLEPD